MAYSEMIPAVLKSLEQRRLERVQPSWATQAGKNIMATPLPQFENPWTQLAAAFGQGLVGSAIQSYGQGQDAEALQAYDQATAETMNKAFAEQDLNKRATILREAGLGGVAQQLNIAQMMTEAERAEKLQDPEYLLRERQFVADQDYRAQELKLKKQGLELERQQITAMENKALADERAASAKSLQEFVSNANDAVKQGNQAQQGLINTMLSKEKVIDVYRDFDSRSGVLVQIGNDLVEAQRRGDTKTVNALLQKATTYFTKQPNEALNVSDAEQFLQQTSYADTVKRFIGKVAGSGGTYVPDYKTVIGLTNAVKTIRDTLERQASEVVTRYTNTADYLSEVPLPPGMTKEQVEALQQQGYLLKPENIFRSSFPDLQMVIVKNTDPDTGKTAELRFSPSEFKRWKKEQEAKAKAKQQATTKAVGSGIASQVMQKPNWQGAP